MQPRHCEVASTQFLRVITLRGADGGKDPLDAVYVQGAAVPDGLAHGAHAVATLLPQHGAWSVAVGW